MGTSGLLALVALAVAGGNALPTVAATAAPLPPRQQGTSVNGGVISGKISCGTPDYCLAIGEDISKSGHLTQVIEEWNGTTWHSVAVPTPKPTVALINLTGVSCKATTDCVLVGAYITPAGAGAGAGGETDAGAERPYALTWNGKSLTPTDAPPVPDDSGFASLTGVSCITTTKSCVAVGDSKGGAGPLLMETWNGAKWTLRTASIPGGAQSAYPAAVSCHFLTFCIVIGESYASAAGTPAMLLARWNGTSFSTMKAAVPADAADITLNDISCPSTTMCAVAGFSSNRSGTSAFGFTEMWNGDSWTADKAAAPNGDAKSFLYGVSCRANGTCVAVGGAGPSTATRATALSYNGKTWTAEDVPSPAAGKSSDLFGVNCLRTDECVAIGEIVGSTTATPLGGLWDGSWRLVAA
jgi:hypothetical protein